MRQQLKKLFYATIVVATLFTISGCAREDAGALIGAVIGGGVGSQVGSGHGRDLATAVGIFGGALAGASIGRSLDALDAANTQQALETNKVNQSSSWVNPDSGNEYIVTPTHTYQTSVGRYCREYQSTVTVGGQPKQGYGTACRQPDGSWEII